MDSEGRGALGLSSPRERQREPLPKESDYGLVMCLAHSLYPVLYIAGNALYCFKLYCNKISNPTCTPKVNKPFQF